LLPREQAVFVRLWRRPPPHPRRLRPKSRRVRQLPADAVSESEVSEWAWCAVLPRGDEDRR
ncbi:MAG: hypothetical protein AAB921_02820, partial [Patescibacteria group bacterium]